MPSLSEQPDEFFDRLREWSAWKHEILKKYLRVWVYKLGSAHDRLAFVDTCAGTGLYANGQQPGSPVIAADWNFKVVRNDRNVWMDVHACEAREAEAAELRKNLDKWLTLTPPRAFIYETQFWNVLPTIVAATRKWPTIFFIDPFGFKELAIDHLRPLLDDRNRASTELLVRADPVMLARFAGWLQKKERSKRGQQTADRFRALLDRLNVDTNQIDLQHAGDLYLDRMGLFEQYLDLFKKRFAYVQLVPIRANYFAEPKYFLVHGTDSPHGAAFLNDVVSTTEDSLYADTLTAEDRETGQGALFAPERQPRYPLRDLHTMILTLVAAQPTKGTSFIALRASLAERFGPDFRERHHKAAVRELIAGGRLQLGDGDKITDSAIVKLVQV